MSQDSLRLMLLSLFNAVGVGRELEDDYDFRTSAKKEILGLEGRLYAVSIRGITPKLSRKRVEMRIATFHLDPANSMEAAGSFFDEKGSPS